jgi:hypothetical protein
MVALAVLASLSIATKAYRFNSNARPSALPAGVTHETTKLNGFNIRMSVTHLIVPAYKDRLSSGRPRWREVPEYNLSSKCIWLTVPSAYNP